MSDERDYLLERIRKLEAIVQHLSFKQDLIFSNSNVDRLLYSYDLSEDQYTQIMNIMDDYREKIINQEEVNHHIFENSIYQIVPQENNNYHFAEELARTFWDEGRWEEVFASLYGNMEKYMYYKKKYE